MNYIKLEDGNRFFGLFLIKSVEKKIPFANGSIHYKIIMSDFEKDYNAILIRKEVDLELNPGVYMLRGVVMIDIDGEDKLRIEDYIKQEVLLIPRELQKYIPIKYK